MRTVVSKDQVAHLWANRSQDHARVQQHNFYFEGDTIYSYGSHFPIARHVETAKGKCILFTTQDYSNTTANHKSTVHGAIRGDSVVFFVQDVTARSKAGHLFNWERMISVAKSTAESAKRSTRWAESQLRSAERDLEEAARYSRYFGLGKKAVSISQFVTEEERAGIMARTAAAVERENARDARRQAEWERRKEEMRKTESERLESWLAGNYHGSLYSLENIYLRVQGEEIQTSRGARFPLAHGIKAFAMIAECRSGSKPWQRNGHSIHLGGFSIDRIEENGDVRAGCHFVRWSEIERIARQVGAIQ